MQLKALNLYAEYQHYLQIKIKVLNTEYREL